MAAPDQTRSRFVEELAGTATVLNEIEEAAIAEAWASGALAEWIALDGQVGELSKAIGEARSDSARLAALVIEWLETGTEPVGPPAWLDDVGRHELVRAVSLGTPSSSEGAIIFEYVAPSGDRHDLSVAIENDMIVGVTIGPAGLVDAAVDHGELAIDAVEAGVALARVNAAWSGHAAPLSPASEATIPLLAKRLGLAADSFATTNVVPVEPLPERSVDDDRYAADVVRSAMRDTLAAPAPDELEKVLTAFRANVRDGDGDAGTVFEVAGMEPTTEVDASTLVRLVGAYLSPASLAPHDPQQVEALIELEPADWTGVIIGLGRSKPGVAVDGDMLVRCINRCPEIATTIPKADAERVGWAFEQMLYAWRVTGVLDEDGSLGESAWWLLPHAAIAAWGS